MKITAILIILLACLSSAQAAEVASCGKEAMAWHPAALPDVIKKEIPNPKDRDKKYTFVQAADLNGDGVDELFVRANFDEAVGQNMDARIYRRQGKTFTKLFGGYVNSSRRPIIILASTTNGYHDICTFNSMGARDTFVTVYQFNGASYKAGQCGDEKFTDDGHPYKTTLKACRDNR